MRVRSHMAARIFLMSVASMVMVYRLLPSGQAQQSVRTSSTEIPCPSQEQP